MIDYSQYGELLVIKSFELETRSKEGWIVLERFVEHEPVGFVTQEKADPNPSNPYSHSLTLNRAEITPVTKFLVGRPRDGLVEMLYEENQALSGLRDQAVLEKEKCEKALNAAYQNLDAVRANLSTTRAELDGCLERQRTDAILIHGITAERAVLTQQLEEERAKYAEFEQRMRRSGFWRQLEE